MPLRHSLASLFSLLAAFALPAPAQSADLPPRLHHPDQTSRARLGANPDTVWVGHSPASSDVHRVAVGGRWDFEISAWPPDSAQGWRFLRAPIATDADLYPLPVDRPWWYYDYGNNVNGIRGYGSAPEHTGLMGVWHVDPMTGVTSPIAGTRSAWCGLRVPGDLLVMDAVTGNPFTGDQLPGDFGGGPGVRSGWPGYADQWDQLLYRDFPTTGAPIALGFDMRTRLSTVVPADPGGSGWFTPDPASLANLELNQPDRFRVWVGVPQPLAADPGRRWLSEVLDFARVGAGAPIQIYQATGELPAPPALPGASLPVALVIPDYSAVSPFVRVVFQVKTNRLDSDCPTSPGGFNSEDGAVVLDNVTVGASFSGFEALADIVPGGALANPAAVWISTGRPPGGYGHVEDLGSLFATGVLDCNLAGNVMLQSNHDNAEAPVMNSNNWAISPTIGFSGTRAASQGISPTLRDEIARLVVEFDYYGGFTDGPPQLFFSAGVRYKGTSHLSLLQPVSPQVPAWSSFRTPATPRSFIGDSCHVVLMSDFVDGYVPWADVDSIQVGLQSLVRCQSGVPALCTQSYGGYFDNVRVGFVRGTPGPVAGTEFPVSFSVNGPVDPHSEGLRDARGAAPTPQAPAQAGNETAFGIRSGAVPPALGIPGPPPGDVSHYSAAGIPADAVFFQSGPPVPGSPQGTKPNGTNNQILQPKAVGLVAGPGLGPALWLALSPERDNVDALSFGTDYFPPGITVGLDPSIPALPDPPAGVVFAKWEDRGIAAPPYKEPIVMDDAPGIVFQFSVDPWAIGKVPSDLATVSGHGDVGAGLGPWTSPGRAAGTIFETPHLVRVGGVTVGGGINRALWGNDALALAPETAHMAPMEDDLDALESTGENIDWVTGLRMWPGNIHGRVVELGVDLPPAGSSQHEPRLATPIFFSVTRNSAGERFSAVRSQFVDDGGAAGDIFVSMKPPWAPAGAGSNLLFIDQAELGLFALDASPGTTGPGDYTDDLDALILSVCPEFRAQLLYLIGNIIATRDTSTFDPVTGAGVGVGMTQSITRYLAGGIPPDCIKVGFSVTTDAIGLGHTGVDWEAGPIAPVGGVSSAAGDIFYATVGGAAANPNYLWYEEEDLGLDAGAWVNGASTNLASLADNLDALDSDSTTVVTVDVPRTTPTVDDRGLVLRGVPNPFRTGLAIEYAVPRPSRVRLRVLDVAGRVVSSLVDGDCPAGRFSATWNGSDRDGGRVAAGVYLIDLAVGDQRITRKVVRLR